MLSRGAATEQCIFCAFRQSLRTLTTSRPRWDRRGSTTQKRLLRPEGRPGRDGNVYQKKLRYGEQRPRRRQDDADDRDDPLRGVYQKSFNPTHGQSFDRRDASSSPNNKTVTAVVQERLDSLANSLHTDQIWTRLKLSPEQLDRRFKSFRKNFELPSMRVMVRDEPINPLMERMRKLAVLKDDRALEQELKYAFYGAVVSSSVKQTDQQFQEQLLNLKYPSEWYPRTRGIQREFHIHVGPTNSGKTYHALKRLEEAKTGVYAGPLRLLAHEVYMRMNARGKPCNLITGDERKYAQDPALRNGIMSCTVEMVPLTQVFDVAVIDEIQMLGSEERGWAWTQALLGVMAREVHVCGEERAVPIIEELAAACGEKVKVHRYERLSPLKLMDQSLQGDFKQLQKGDCIVGFSIVMLHSLRQYVEKVTGKKCAIIYGTLPPETRTQQANLFNDPDNDYDYLVASNAVGMGLNLSIKRLIFQAGHKTIRGRVEPIPIPEIKQIAGRAGRYSTASQDMKTSTESLSEGSNTAPQTVTVQAIDAPSANAEASDEPLGDPDIMAVQSDLQPTQVQPATSKDKTLGLVTTLEKLDYPVIAKAMRTEPLPMTSAGVLPPTSVIEQFSRYFPRGTPLAFLLLRLKEIAGTNRRFFLCDIKGQVATADAIEEVPGLTITDRLEFCAAPIETRREGEPELARAYASMVGQARPGTVLDVEELDLELLQEDYKPDREYLRKLESLHKGLIIFNWLAFRFTGVFMDERLATHVKELVEKRIEETLGQMSFDYRRLRRTRDQALLDLLQNDDDGNDQADEDSAEGRNQTSTTDTEMSDGSAHEDYSESSGGSDEPASSAQFDRMDHKRATNVGHGSGVEHLPDTTASDHPGASPP